MLIEGADLPAFAVYKAIVLSDFNPGIGIGGIIFSFHRKLIYTRLMHNEESVSLYWDFIGGFERFTPPNPLLTPRQPTRYIEQITG